MSELLDLETKLTILANNPCACIVCIEAARLAQHTLRDTAPSAKALLELPRNTPEFHVAEMAFHADELTRLQTAYNVIGRGRCLLAPALEPDRSEPPPPPQYTVTPIPDLPDPELYRAQIEHYRKHAMGPRLTHRRSRSITKLKRPRVPGSYLIK